MTKPNIKMDWTINIGSVGAAVVFMLGCLASWYNLKQEVAVNKATSDVKFSQIDSSFAEVKTQIDKTADIIREDLRDIHKDINSMRR